MDEWFKNWFNTKEYLSVYSHRNSEDAEKLVNLILSVIKISEGAKILDLACGAGRHSIHFAKKGFYVTAADISENLLLKAKKEAREAKVHIDFIKCDIRDFPVTGVFDLVLNLFTSFGYFGNDCENFIIFEIAANVLKKGGFFVLDFFNKEFVERNLVKESINIFDGVKIIQRRSIVGKRVVKRISIIKDGIEKHYHESVRMYSKEELIGAFTEKGFAIKDVFGDFKGNSFDRIKSPRIIITAQK